LVRFERDLTPLLTASIELERYRKREPDLQAFFAVWDRYVANDTSVSEHDVAVAMQRVRGK
jgi:hypothetical protein